MPSFTIILTSTLDHCLELTTHDADLKERLLDLESKVRSKGADKVKLFQSLLPCSDTELCDTLWGCPQEATILGLTVSKNGNDLTASISYQTVDTEPKALIEYLSKISTKLRNSTLTDDKVFYHFDGQKKTKPIEILSLNLANKKKVVPILRELRDLFGFELSDEIDTFIEFSGKEWDDELVDELLELIDDEG